MPVTLTSVWKGDELFEKTMNDFVTGWDASQGPRPHVHHIFKVEHNDDDVAAHYRAHNAYAKQKGNVQYLFHGTERSCRTGDQRNWTTPCSHPDCSLCGILRCDFDFKRAGSAHGEMFGAGVYTANMSSKAAEYSVSKDPSTKQKILLLSQVVVGKTYLAKQAEPSFKAPPAGYDSVTGATKAQGGQLLRPETVVYIPEALCVEALIVYEP